MQKAWASIMQNGSVQYEFKAAQLLDPTLSKLRGSALSDDELLIRTTFLETAVAFSGF